MKNLLKVLGVALGVLLVSTLFIIGCNNDAKGGPSAQGGGEEPIVLCNGNCGYLLNGCPDPATLACGSGCGCQQGGPGPAKCAGNTGGNAPCNMNQGTCTGFGCTCGCVGAGIVDPPCPYGCGILRLNCELPTASCKNCGCGCTTGGQNPNQPTACNSGCSQPNINSCSSGCATACGGTGACSNTSCTVQVVQREDCPGGYGVTCGMQLGSCNMQYFCCGCPGSKPPPEGNCFGNCGLPLTTCGGSCMCGGSNCNDVTIAPDGYTYHQPPGVLADWEWVDAAMNGNINYSRSLEGAKMKVEYTATSGDVYAFASLRAKLPDNIGATAATYTGLYLEIDMPQSNFTAAGQMMNFLIGFRQGGGLPAPSNNGGDNGQMWALPNENGQWDSDRSVMATSSTAALRLPFAQAGQKSWGTSYPGNNLQAWLGSAQFNRAANTGLNLWVLSNRNLAKGNTPIHFYLSKVGFYKGSGGSEEKYIIWKFDN